jgi:hypothetical protein
METITIEDIRHDFFIVDNVFYDEYAQPLGMPTCLVYMALCRHADKNRMCFPGQIYLSEKLGMHRTTVNKSIIALENWNIIKVSRYFSEKTGRYLTNRYTLLPCSEWKPM